MDANTIAILIAAIITVESGGDCGAVGDNGASVGPMQIQMCVVKDVNEYLRAPVFGSDDRRDLEASKYMFGVYMNRYATKKRLGREPTAEDVSRIWNGGPNGYKKEATVKYWNKVEKEMEKRK